MKTTLRTRPLGTIAIALAALALTACTGGAGSGTAKPTPTVLASAADAGVDPVANGVPVDGDDSLALDWSLADGVNGDDPVVDVARKTTALILLAQSSPGWSDVDKLQALAHSLTDESKASISPGRMAEWAADPGKAATEYPIRLLVQKPRIQGDEASVFVCMDAAAAVGSSPVPGSGAGIVRLDLRVEDGYWRTTSYDQNTSNWTHEDYQVCKDF